MAILLLYVEKEKNIQRTICIDFVLMDAAKTAEVQAGVIQVCYVDLVLISCPDFYRVERY
jgi:hypothetical protein